MGRVAYFVSPHGFGHAARACAVMFELQRRCPTIHFELFTGVPEWFFADSLPRCFSYHRAISDVGMVQDSPLVEDLQATVERLDEMWRDGGEAERLGERARELGCAVAVVDISPQGLAAAAAASLPSVLIENFTWDWVYAHYPGAPSGLREHGRRMAGLFAAADLRIQAEPICDVVPAAVKVPPVARTRRLDRATVRARIGVPPDEPMVVVSMGGVRWDYGRFSHVEDADSWIVVPGGSERTPHRRGRLILLPFRTDFFHPDLVAASDVVVGKLGYSTVAEAYRAGAALAYVGRPRFPESPVLARWVEEHMVAAEITADTLDNGDWLGIANRLLKVPRREPPEPNGAEVAVEVILERFKSLFG